MTAWEKDESTVELFSILGADLNGSWNTFWILIVVLFATVFELDGFHKFSGDIIVKGVLRIVTWLQHKVFPEFLWRVVLLDMLVLLESSSQNRRKDVDHTVIGTLSSSGVTFSWISDNTKSGLVTCDLDFLNVLVISSVQNFINILRNEVDNCIDG